MSESNMSIRVEGLSKSYRLGLTHSQSIRDLLNRTARRLTGRKESNKAFVPTEQKDRIDEDGLFWALRDINFEVSPGEVLGVIGKNGAGKSTLLKLLSRITAPTIGRIELRGRVASLLEVGTGFHPELTGRENVYLNGTILGMTKSEISKQFDEIVAFGGVEEFIDTPVKRYSSGMTVRLGFAVAAHLNPEILIVDEVLAVGDAEFQKRCLKKMEDVSQSGRTILFVSHNMASIRSLTNRAILISKGELVESGPTDDVVAHYLRQNGIGNSDGSVQQLERSFAGLSRRMEWVTLNVDESTIQDGMLSVNADVLCNDPNGNWQIGMTIYRSDETVVGTTFSPPLVPQNAGEQIKADMSLAISSLSPGSYYCAISLVESRDFRQMYDTLSHVLQFTIPQRSAERTWTLGWGPIQFPELNVSVCKPCDMLSEK